MYAAENVDKIASHFYEQGKADAIKDVVNKSKTTGEPPLMLAMSVFFAIKDAISSVSNYKKIPKFDAPATAENILLGW